jgi:plastocyanin
MKVLFAILVITLSGEAASVTGRVRFVGRPPGVAAPTIVYAEALDGNRVQPGKFKMEQKNKTFVPHVLAVPVGSTITIPNQDPIFHNAFSLSRPGPFDLGLYRDGESKSHTFTAPATYRVFCNIHPQMSAIILVLPTSYIAEADAMGSYRLDLPPGRYRLTAWSERAEPVNTELIVGSSGMNAPELSLDESKFVDTQHKNKFGQDYSKKN